MFTLCFDGGTAVSNIYESCLVFLPPFIHLFEDVNCEYYDFDFSSEQYFVVENTKGSFSKYLIIRVKH